jgi:hypothetical protein
MLETTSHWPLLLSAPPLAFLLWWVSLALGYRILRSLRVPLGVFSTWERGSVCLAIGAGAMQYGPYALAAAQRLSPRNVGIGFALLALLLSADLLRVASAVARGIARLSLKRLSPSTLGWLVLFGALMALLLINALVLGPFGTDDDGYHLSAPRRWLEAGTLRYLPTYTNTNASLGFEMLYALGLATGNPGVKLIHYSAGLFTLFALWLVGRRLANPWAGITAISLLLIANPVCNITLLFGLGYVDFGACWMTITSVLVWLVWRQERRRELLLCMALCSGLAASFKSTALSVAIAWAPVLIWEARQRGTRWSQIIKAAGLLGLVAFLPVCPWIFRTWRLTGNPVFPMLSSVIPTRDWNPEIARVFGRFFHYYSWGVRSGAALSEGHRRLIVAGTAILVGSTGLVAAARLRDSALRLLACFAACFTVISIVMAGMVFRYWLPGEMCAVLVASCWLSKWVVGGTRRWLPSVLLIVALGLELTNSRSSLPLAKELRIATGIRTFDQENAGDPGWNMWRFISANTPRDARILVAAFYTSFGAANYGCSWLDRRCYTTDSHMQAYIRFDAWSSFQQSLNTAEINYVLIRETEVLKNRQGYSFTAGSNEYPFCRKLVDTSGEKLAQFGALQFYRLVSVPPPLAAAL